MWRDRRGAATGEHILLLFIVGGAAATGLLYVGNGIGSALERGSDAFLVGDRRSIAARDGGSPDCGRDADREPDEQLRRLACEKARHDAALKRIYGATTL